MKHTYPLPAKCFSEKKSSHKYHLQNVNSGCSYRCRDPGGCFPIRETVSACRRLGGFTLTRNLDIVNETLTFIHLSWLYFNVLAKF